MPRHFCRDLAEPPISKLLIHAASVLWARASSVNRNSWINNTNMNCKCGLVWGAGCGEGHRFRLMRWSGIMDWVLTAVCVELDLAWGLFVPPKPLARQSSPAAVYALGGVCMQECMCANVKDSVGCWPQDGAGWTFSVSMFNATICIDTALFMPMFACMPVPTWVLVVCALISIFSDVCVWSDHKCVHSHPLSISLPFHPSFHHFTQQHQGLASWCLHCKSGPTIRRWLDPTHIQKHLIYLFIFLSCMASRCIISDQADMPTSKCYSLHLQFDLLVNKLKQIKWDSEGRICKCRLCASTERPLSWFSLDQVPEFVRVLKSVSVSELREWI